MSETERGRGAGENGSGGEIESPLHPVTLSPLHSIAPLALVALAAIWLYRHALGFAYFNDDPTGHFAWMEGQSILQFFVGSADYGYYRPMVFVVLRLTELLFGNAAFPHNPVADHALLVLLHGANTAMVWALARRLGSHAAYAWVAALVFAFVPFSYEAVAYVASLTHPLVVFWTLLALLLYDHGRQGNYELGITNYELKAGSNLRKSTHQTQITDHWILDTDHWSLFAALLAMTAGLLTHENGLFIFPAMVGVDWVTRRGTLRERARRLWPFVVPPVLFAVLWVVIPKNSEQGLNSLSDIGRNLVPFLQTLTYPLLPVARFDSSDVWPLALTAVAAVALCGWLAWRAGAVRLWVFALGWFALSSLPALLFLGPAYVYGSPRLSYLPSIGVALMWGIPVLWLWQVGSQRQTTDDGRQTTDDTQQGNQYAELATRHSSLVTSSGGRRSAVLIALTAAYTVAILLPPLPFIRCQLNFYDETSRFAREMAATGAAAPAERDLIVVNAPFFFSSTAEQPDGCPSPYPWTPVGGILIPPYAQPRDFVRFNGGPDRPVAGVTYSGYGPGWRTFGPAIDGETLRKHAAEDAPYVFDLLTGSFADLSAAWQPEAGPAAEPLVTFGSALALSGVDMQQDADHLTVQLGWRVIGESQDPLAAFVHVYGAAGTPVAQSDGPPGDGLVPQALWRTGDGLADERVLDLSTLPPGGYTVAVGVYNATDGTRLTAESNGAVLSDNLFVIGVIER